MPAYMLQRIELSRKPKNFMKLAITLTMLHVTGVLVLNVSISQGRIVLRQEIFHNV